MKVTPHPRNDHNEEASQETNSKEVFTAVSSVNEKLNAIEKFIARRFDEISMEINATSQQVDMVEGGLADRFGEILEVLKAVSYQGDGTTAANAGVELDAVVDMTEQAANRILDAADRISTRIHEAKGRGAVNSDLSEIDKDVEEIFMACSFQDITGQRIRKTLDNIKMVEERLSNALNKIGIHVEANAQDHDAIKNKLSTQNDIDDFFAENAHKDK